jgi:hypothetical protein
MDSSQSVSKVDSTVIVVKDTIISVPDKPFNPIWITTAKEILVAYAWPLTFLILIFIFRTPIRVILTFAGDFVRNLEEIVIEKYGLKMRRGTSSTGVPTLALDAKSVTELTPDKILADDYINKIFKTLWHYQIALSKDFSQRWSFVVGAFSPESVRFITAMRFLGALGLVAQDKNSQQFFLTDFGIVFCKQNEGKLKQEMFTFT